MTDRVTINPAAIAEILNGSRARAELEAVGEIAVGIAEEEYLRQAKGEEKGPVLYIDSFYTEVKPGPSGATLEVGNHDPEAVFVEFGLSAGPKGDRVYRYAPLRRALDSLESLRDI